MPSAGDVERFGYCAHNWWLSRHGKRGEGGDVDGHFALGRQQDLVERDKRESTEWLRWSFRILSVAASAAFLTLWTIYLRGETLDWVFLLIALVMISMSGGLLTLALLQRQKANRETKAAGLVPGALLDSDLQGEGELLHDPEWDLHGRPDYTLQTKHGIVPVEVKTSKTPKHPHESHTLQLAVYLRLLEVNGQAPQYGLLTYPEGTFRVDWDASMQRYLKGTLDRIAAATETGSADRDHEHVGRCKGCSRRADCDQRLA